MSGQPSPRPSFHESQVRAMERGCTIRSDVDSDTEHKVVSETRTKITEYYSFRFTDQGSLFKSSFTGYGIPTTSELSYNLLAMGLRLGRKI